MDYLLLIVRLLGPVAGCLRVQKQIFMIHNLYFHACPTEPLRTARRRNFKFILVPRRVLEMFLGRSVLAVSQPQMVRLCPNGRNRTWPEIFSGVTRL